jgi:hypothetical protein
MATIAKELHGGLGTLIDKLTTMVADLQKIDTKQWDCLYMLDVMAVIRSADVKWTPTPLPSPPLPTPLSTTTISVTPPLPYPPSPSATVVAMCAHTTKTGNTAEIINKVTTPAPSSSLDEHRVEIRPAPPPTSPTTSAVVIWGPEIPPAPPSSAQTGAATACKTPSQPAPALAAHTTSAAVFCGPGIPPAVPLLLQRPSPPPSVLMGLGASQLTYPHKLVQNLSRLSQTGSAPQLGSGIRDRLTAVQPPGFSFVTSHSRHSHCQINLR